MRIPPLRLLLGWFVLVHALAHAALPARGAMAPAIAVNDWVPIVFYIITTIGFLMAALGLFEIRPFDRMISPVLALSAAWSFIVVTRLGDLGLWPGAWIDAGLFTIALWRALAGWPPLRQFHHWAWRAAATTAGVLFFAYMAIAATTWPWHRTWGSTPSEIAMALPGDRPDRQPALEIQHAITIDAPPQAVWPWLVQLGQDRAGFYSYDWLERAFGADVHNVNQLRPEWQTRQVGDFVRAAQPSYLGGVLGSTLGWTVTDLQEGRALVLSNWGAFVLLPTDDGRTRFIVRSTTGQGDTPPWLAALDFIGFQLPHFIMERRMMLTIKSLAEKHAGQTTQARGSF